MSQELKIQNWLESKGFVSANNKGKEYQTLIENTWVKAAGFIQSYSVQKDTSKYFGVVVERVEDPNNLKRFGSKYIYHVYHGRYQTSTIDPNGAGIYRNVIVTKDHLLKTIKSVF